MTDHSNKRNADCLIEDSIDRDGAGALETLTNMLNEHIKTCENHIKNVYELVGATNKHIDATNERFDILEQAVHKLAQAQGTERNQDDDEDISDDEQSVADETSKWAIMFRLLREYRITNGDFKVSKSENQKLSNWIKNQRFLYANAKTGKSGSKLSNEKIIKLDSIGFFWGVKFPPPVSWDEMFEQLKNYKQRMGNCNIPINATNPTPLAKWVAYQRKEYVHFKFGRPSLITLDQIGMLRECGFKWKDPQL